MFKLAHSFCKQIVQSLFFERLIIFVILINCLLIGVETYFTNTYISYIQSIALFIFTIEVFLRYFSSDTNKHYFLNSWNMFDLFIVIICFIPESLFSNTETITALRVLRVFRVLRLLKVSDEIKLIVSVLVRSFSALLFNGLFFFIFLYLFAVIGVTLFEIPDATMLNENQIQLFDDYTTIVSDHHPDPYGTLHESMFTLFRVLTADDWTDVRYNLIHASKLNLIHVSQSLITIYHILWVIISSFLLLNLLVGAILNNYNVIMDEMKNAKD